MMQVQIAEAQQRLAELIEDTASGEDVRTSRCNGFSFRFVLITELEARLVFGSARDKIAMCDDFDGSVTELEPYMSCASW